MITYMVLSNFKSFTKNLLESFEGAFNVVFSSIDITSAKTTSDDSFNDYDYQEEYELEIEKCKVRER